MHTFKYVYMHKNYLKVAVPYKREQECGEEDVAGGLREENRNQYVSKDLHQLTGLSLSQQ
jgi:hypothetical protein